MNKRIVSAWLIAAMLAAAVAGRSASAFSASGCEGDCKKCHSLTKQEVNGILAKLKQPKAKILGIRLSPVKSLWEVTVEDAEKKRGLFYVDFSKGYIIAGQIVEVGTGSNKTQESMEKLQADRKVDTSRIPLADALVLGDAKARKRVIVFTDPDCPYCAKLHQEMKKVVKDRKDIVFFVKLFPLKGHKDAYWKAKSISCRKSLQMMEDNFEGRAIPKVECATREVDETMKLGEALGITGTPTMVLANGKVVSGMLPAGELINRIDGRIDGRPDGRQ
jgi:thiol:disulfide interchange protein DsbC